MSKRGYISRYMLIIKKLKAKPYSSYEELRDYIDARAGQLQLRDESLEIGFSKRTLQRDIREISNLFGVAIVYSKPGKGYCIEEGSAENMNFQRMIETFDVFHSLNLAQDMAPYIHLQKQRPQGTENLYGLLHAIKSCLYITYDYQKFWEEAATRRQAAPYALKEFKNRWYVLAHEAKGNKVKTFALDRITQLELTNKHFTFPQDYNAEESFRHCFGIISADTGAPKEIVLSFDPFQGKYIKTLPLHESQSVIADNKDELRISLQLYITHDFIMELLSLGQSVRVIKPASLVKEIKAAHTATAKQYL